MYEELISAYYRQLAIQHGDPIAKQCFASPLEYDKSLFDEDGLGEKQDYINAHFIHRYPHQALVLATSRCAMYCRFCFRKRLWAHHKRMPDINEEEIEQIAHYLKSHPEVNDLLISGGDPLLLDHKLLKKLLDTFSEISSVECLRIGSRLMVTDPERITPALANMLGAYSKLNIMTHFNHPYELTPLSLNACHLLQKNQLPLLNQTVLLKGINDDVPTLKNLFNTLASHRIRPHYLFHVDPVAGVSHFATGLRNAHALYQNLRSVLSSLALPRMAIDLPSAQGKIIISPDLPLPDDLVFTSPLTLQKIKYPFE